MIKTHYVVCFQQRLTHYRENFFQRCRNRLAEKNIVFDLVYGGPNSAEMTKKDSGSLQWAYEVNEVTFFFGKKTAVWLPMPAGAHCPDLVVVAQENKLLGNYVWLLRRYFGGPKVAFWGHGRNFQSTNPDGLREKWKSLLSGLVDWWFCYTELTKEILLNNGYSSERISVLNNAIDADGFRSDIMSLRPENLKRCRDDVGNGPIALFCGSLYSDKKIDFLIAAADRIRVVFPDFALVVAGDGPDFHQVVLAAKSRPWLHVLGAKTGLEKAAWFKSAKVILNPGAAGLLILDSFAAGVPMVTTRTAKHGPEIAYLVDKENGLVVDGGVDEYANAVIELLQNRSMYEKIQKAGLAASEVYTLDNMVAKFVDGIEACLVMPKK